MEKDNIIASKFKLREHELKPYLKDSSLVKTLDLKNESIEWDIIYTILYSMKN